MHQYDHYPVDGNTFRERLRNVSFTRRRWQDCPAMPCPGCGCRIIPSIPATILQDVCLMLGFFLFSAELSASPDARTRFPSLGRALRFTVVGSSSLRCRRFLRSPSHGSCRENHRAPIDFIK